MNSLLEKVKCAALTMQRYDWEQGVVAQAFLEAGDTDTAILLAIEAAHRQDTNGRCAAMGEPFSATDPCAIGEALIFACEQIRDPFLFQAKERLIKWATVDAPRNPNGIVYHVIGKPQFWVDSLYMLPPFLARAGLYAEATKQIEGYWNALYEPGKGLFEATMDDREENHLRLPLVGCRSG